MLIHRYSTLYSGSVTLEFIWIVTANDYIIILVWPCHARFISRGGAYFIFLYISLDQGTAAELRDLIDEILLILLVERIKGGKGPPA